MSSAKTGAMSAARLPGSYCSISASYGSSPVLSARMAASSRTSAITLSSDGRKPAQSFFGAKVAPELLGAHARRGLALDELDRQAGQIGVVAAELAERRLLVLVERLAAGGLDPVGDLRGGRAGVQHAGERSHRLGALLAAADRHMRRLVGAEDGQRMLQRFELAAEFVELGEGHGDSVR